MCPLSVAKWSLIFSYYRASYFDKWDTSSQMSHRVSMSEQVTYISQDDRSSNESDQTGEEPLSTEIGHIGSSVQQSTPTLSSGKDKREQFLIELKPCSALHKIACEAPNRGSAICTLFSCQWSIAKKNKAVSEFQED